MANTGRFVGNSPADFPHSHFTFSRFASSSWYTRDPPSLRARSSASSPRTASTIIRCRDRELSLAGDERVLGDQAGNVWDEYMRGKSVKSLVAGSEALIGI